MGSRADLVPPEFLTAREVASRLRVSEASIRTWLAQGTLPGFRVGKGWRIRPAALEEWLADAEKRSAS